MASHPDNHRVYNLISLVQFCASPAKASLDGTVVHWEDPIETSSSADVPEDGEVCNQWEDHTSPSLNSSSSSSRSGSQGHPAGPKVTFARGKKRREDHLSFATGEGVTGPVCCVQ